MSSVSSPVRSPRWSLSEGYKAALALILLLCLAVFAVRTWRWPLVGDPPGIHYVVFLIEHGRAPYRQIVDVNMPGTYLVEWLGMQLLGGGSQGWRIFDLLLGATAVAAMASIAWPRDRFAGFLAGALFVLLHGRDGITEMGQRDFTMAVLLLIAYAFLFRTLRAPAPGKRLAATALCGFFLAFAASVKPTAIVLAPPLVALLCLELRRRRAPWLRHLAAAAAGFSLAVLAALLFLLRERAVRAFFYAVFHIVPMDAHLLRLPFGYLLSHSLAGNLLPVLLLWLPLAVLVRRRPGVEWFALLLGLLFGVASFCVQGKGYSYHRYPAEAFLLVMVCIDACAALASPPHPGNRWRKPLASATLAVAVVVAGIGSTRKALQFNWHDRQFGDMLRADLTRLGGPALNGHVQCMDMAAGCVATLYNMRLMPATRFLYDCYLFEPGKAPDDYRRQFLQAVESHPPVAFVFTNHICGEPGARRPFQEIHAWPPLSIWLASHYFLYTEGIPPSPVYWEGRPGPPHTFRIYVRDDYQPPTPPAPGTPAAAPS